ncbi:MAG: hypothetical protein IEMM0006_2228 [bacterium]|nr:MAG: hypothetical protein IEMM0006_2228 [bacterium]
MFRFFPFGKRIFLLFILLGTGSYFAFGNVYDKYPNDSVKIQRLLDAAKINSSDSALILLDNAERLAHTLKTRLLLAKVYIQRGNLLMKNNQLVAADSVFRMAKGLFVNRKKNNQYLLLLKNLAICNYYLGNNPKVLNYTLEGLAVARKLNNTLFQGTFNNISGIAMDVMGNRAQALKYYLQALDIFESLKDEEKIASVEINIGILYEEQGNDKKAEKYFMKAYQAANRIQDTSLMAGAYNNMANIYSDRKEYKRALAYFFKSLALSRKKNESFSIPIDLNNIGDSYMYLKNYSSALDYYQQALKLAQKNQDSRTITVTLSSLAQIYEIKKDIPKAIRYATESLEQAKNGGDVSDLLVTIKLLYHLYAKKGDYKEAYSYFQKYQILHDSVFSAQKEEQFNKVQMNYASRGKDQAFKLAREKQKISHAYLMVSLFALLLVIVAAVFLIRLRIVKSRALKRRIQFADNLLEYSESFVLILDSNFRISYLSPSYQKAFGHYLKDRKGDNLFDFIYPDETEGLKKALESFFLGKEKRIEIAFRLKKSTGEYRYMQGVFNNRLDNPDLNGFILNFWDVTDMRKTQLAISQSEKKYYDIFNAFPDIYFRMGMKGIITEISPSVSSIVGFDRHEVIDNSIFDFVEMDMGWEKARKILYRLKHVKDFSLTLRTKNGKKIYCSLNVHDVKNHQGDIIGFEGVLRDISGRVLAEKQLQQSERELKEANASKDKILSIIGHDLLGPIGTQKSILDMVIDDVEDFSREEILKLLQTMKPSLDATFTMIENLLSWARIMRRSIKPNLKQNDLSHIVEKSFDLLKQQAEQKKIKLVYSGDKKVLAVFDRNLMDIVIRNLLSNAIKFSNPDSEIRVAAVKQEKVVKVSISDQGMGLTDEDIHTILKEKEKIESRLGTRKEKGTGLGLIVVKEFIQLNNGKLHIESRPGPGTTFSFSLPLV